jgi:O-antigen/teichoic acid export membrane protein
LAYISWLLLANALISTWTGSATLGSEIAPVAIVLALGHSINALMVPSHAAFIAMGNSRVPAAISTILAAIFVPLLFFLCAKFGAMGAALNFSAMNLTYFLIGMILTRRLVTNGDMATVLLKDIAPATFVAVAALFVDKTCGLPRDMSVYLIVQYVMVIAVCGLVILVLMPSLRGHIVTSWAR